MTRSQVPATGVAFWLMAVFLDETLIWTAEKLMGVKVSALLEQFCQLCLALLEQFCQLCLALLDTALRV